MTLGRQWATGLVSILLNFVFLADTAAAVPPPKFGTTSEAIGTFDGWSFWIGWEAGFSDTYAPEKERYGWIVYFAPEAIYLALEPSMAVYSAVDVNLGYKYLYGFLHTESADRTLTKEYREELWSVSISRPALHGFEGAGPMAHLQMEMELEASFFRIKHTKTLVPAYQEALGFSVAYSLLPIDLPFKVELQEEWSPKHGVEPAFSGFWPIVVWNRPSTPGQNPADGIASGLRDLARDPAASGTASVMAGMLGPVMQKLSDDPDLRAFLANPRGNHRLGKAMSTTETWLQTGDTSKAPGAVVPADDGKTAEVVKPILVATGLAYQTGYRVGAQANPKSKVTYLDGVVTNYAYVGELCTIEVKAEELSTAVPGTKPADFEKAWIGFSLPLEYLTSRASADQREWVQITNGVARFTLTESFSTPQFVRVRYADKDSGGMNHGYDLELKGRLLIFLDPSDANANGIPDWWEKQYGLTNPAPGADADGDGATDLQEFLAGTNPTNATQRLRLNVAPKSLKTLTIPFTSSARRYTVQANTNAALPASGWTTVEDFFGEDAASEVDISKFLKARQGFFRVKVSRY